MHHISTPEIQRQEIVIEIVQNFCRVDHCTADTDTDEISIVVGLHTNPLYWNDGDLFQQHIVAGDEIWCHHFQLEVRPQLLEFKEPDALINAQRYTQTLDTLHKAIKNKDTGTLVTGSSRFKLKILLGSLGLKKANSFQPNPEAKREDAN
ncbi:hypothetical protein TNCV_4018981 [Trichonephila clavipes]|nr:hypothetical protein TNCV_4018981 [Trichonephila clavipes]